MTAKELKIGDFITASYKYSAVSGIIKRVNKSSVVVNRHQQNRNTYTPLNIDLNITISRIREVNPEGITIESAIETVAI